MDQYSSNTTTIPSSFSSPPPHLPLFLDSIPFLSPSTLLPFDSFHPSLPPPPPPRPPSPAPPPNSKKRSRASRRAPTTVLTTDTSNFRAMVQEFTGIPSPPFSSSSSTLLSLPSRSPLHFPPPFLTRPFSNKHQTTTTPNTLPLPPLSLSSNTFLQSLINTQPVFAAKPPYPSPPAFSMAGREELQQSQQGGTMLDSWICSAE